MKEKFRKKEETEDEHHILQNDLASKKSVVEEQVKSKQELESKLRESSKKVSSLQADVKNIEEKSVKQQADLVKAREDLTNCQIKAQKLTSVNNDFKHQYLLVYRKKENNI